LKKWTKEEALKTLKELANEADRLSDSKARSTEHTVWLTKCFNIFEEVFGPTSMYFVSFYALKWYETQSFIIEVGDAQSEQAAIDAKQHEAFLRSLETAKGLLLGAFDYLNERELTEVYREKGAGTDASLVLRVLHLAEHRLRKVIRDKPEKEKQVQDAFENLLIGTDITYGREIDSIEYSSKTYIPDFSLTEISLAVEVKLCSRKEREKELPAEINDDILAYQTKYQNILFVIYDLGYIRDVDLFCGSFEKHENVTIRVVKH